MNPIKLITNSHKEAVASYHAWVAMRKKGSAKIQLRVSAYEHAQVAQLDELSSFCAPGSGLSQNWGVKLAYNGQKLAKPRCERRVGE